MGHSFYKTIVSIGLVFGIRNSLSFVPISQKLSTHQLNIPHTPQASHEIVGTVTRISKNGVHQFLAKESSDSGSIDETEKEWVNSALLISSFSDGVESSEEAMDFLKQGLISSMLKERIQQTEDAITESVKFSPCSGPDIDLLNQLEELDQAKQMEQALFKALTDDGDSIQLRILYIPTAMYALRADSTNTPGKQRQRARADGKKRRSQLIATVDKLFRSEKVQIHAVTFDFDDDSIKQPTGFNDDNTVPKTGKEALLEWKPHLIYVEGGNTFWLQYCMEKGDYFKDIENACVGPDAYAMYCGKSAGAIVAGTTIETALWKGWDDPNVVPSDEKTSYKGLSFVGNTDFFPHMNDDWNTLVNEKEKEILPNNLVTLEDTEVCCIYGSEKVFKKISATSKMAIHNN